MSAYRIHAVRDRAAWTFPEDVLPEPFQKCPACGHDMRMWICSMGHAHPVAIKEGGECWEPLCRAKAAVGFDVTTCMPEARIKTGFLSRCRGPGIHLHHRCKNCEWSGISKPVTDLRSSPLAGDPTEEKR